MINHTAAQTGTGYNGTVVTNKYDTPYYDPADSDDCTKTISNWSDRYEVQHCELLGLPDLDTAECGVRTKITGFLNQQIDLGVDGFRVDAAKHIDAADLSAIVAGLHTTTSGAAPYITQEIYPGTPPAQDEYYGTGDVLDFTFAAQMKSQFQGDIANLSSFGSSWGLTARRTPTPSSPTTTPSATATRSATRTATPRSSPTSSSCPPLRPPVRLLRPAPSARATRPRRTPPVSSPTPTARAAGTASTATPRSPA